MDDNLTMKTAKFTSLENLSYTVFPKYILNTQIIPNSECSSSELGLPHGGD